MAVQKGEGELRTKLEVAPVDGFCNMMNRDRSACKTEWVHKVDIGCKHEHISRYHACTMHKDAVVQVRFGSGWRCNVCLQTNIVEVVEHYARKLESGDIRMDSARVARSIEITTKCQSHSCWCEVWVDDAHVITQAQNA